MRIKDDNNNDIGLNLDYYDFILLSELRREKLEKLEKF
jgi:hypothetical protein